jgi:hypothetical protein
MTQAEPRAHWWNGAGDKAARRDIWVDLLPDGRYLVRWRGGDWQDRDGRHIYSTREAARIAVQALLKHEPERWRRVL